MEMANNRRYWRNWIAGNPDAGRKVTILFEIS
jgi:hypothetical protein